MHDVEEEHDLEKEYCTCGVQGESNGGGSSEGIAGCAWDRARVGLR